MKTYNTQQLIEVLQQQTEDILNTVQQWQALNPLLVKAQANEKSWSAMQCLGHLNAYGRYYLPAIEKAINKSKQQASETFTPGWLGNYFTKLMLPDAKGIAVKKMKAPSNYTINNDGNSDEIIAEFIDQQEKLLVLLQRGLHVNISNVRIVISLTKLIKLKLGDVFMFLIAHNIRHIKQAERAIEGAGNSTLMHSSPIVSKLFAASL